MFLIKINKGRQNQKFYPKGLYPTEHFEITKGTAFEAEKYPSEK